MSTRTQELIHLCERLPDDKREEVADFARFLLAKQQDDALELSLAKEERRPKLDAFLRESVQEPAESLDPTRL